MRTRHLFLSSLQSSPLSRRSNRSPSDDVLPLSVDGTCCGLSMLGLSYGEVFLLVGATAALIGPKDLPIIARTAGRWVGRAIGYVQMARGQFDSVMQQSQATQVHKELQDAMAQLEAIRYEIRSISVMNPGPISRRLMDATETKASTNGTELSQKVDVEIQAQALSKERNSSDLNSNMLQSQAVKYARLAESTSMRSSLTISKNEEELYSDGGLLNVLPISAESAGMLPGKTGRKSTQQIQHGYQTTLSGLQGFRHWHGQRKGSIVAFFIT